MPSLTLTDDQAIDLVKQLPSDQQAALLRYLLMHHWSAWVDLAGEGERRIRTIAAERGRNWDSLTEAERAILVDDLVHEGR